jgi:hypothetical protein
MTSGSIFIIHGVTHSGQQFRPSNWAARLAGTFACIGPHRRISYSPFVRPATIDGLSCVVINSALEHADPGAFAFVLEFAAGNQLQVTGSLKAKASPPA